MENKVKLGNLPNRIDGNRRETMCKALIVPYFDYSSCVGGYIGKGLSEKLQQLQNKAARIVTSSNYQTRSKDILDELGWEVLEDRRMRQLAILMYKITHGISPPYLRNIFANVSDVHSYNLRNSSINLFIPKPKLEIGKHSLHYRGTKFLYIEARKKESLGHFKSFLLPKDIVSEVK